MIKNKKTLIFAAVIIAILTISYFWGGNVPSPSTTEKSSNLTAEEKIQMAQQIVESTVDVVETNAETETNTDADIDINSIPDVKPHPKQSVIPIEEPTNSTKDTVATTCYISVRCDSVLNNLQYLDENKKSIIPQDGIIYENPAAVIYEGESAFNLLSRELKKNNIHYEYVKTPAYNSVYIEGIGNLYEFDCGDLSGWLYKVNGKSPSYGCSQYILSPGDKVEFIYSCNLGIDVGGYKEIAD